MSIIVANWKMHYREQSATLLLREVVSALLQESNKISRVVVFCPPYVYLKSIIQELDNIIASSPAMPFRFEVGAQNVSEHIEDGAYTGQISASMLSDLGCAYSIIGHSESRSEFSESDQSIAKKAASLKKASITPIICIGESKKQRTEEKYRDFLLDQLNNALSTDNKNAIVAYEPLWAIGSGSVPTIDEIREVVDLIKSLYPDLKVLYGGSVSQKVTPSLRKIEGLDGLLVGGASLIAKEFVEIIRALGFGALSNA